MATAATTSAAATFVANTNMADEKAPQLPALPTSITSPVSPVSPASPEASAAAVSPEAPAASTFAASTKPPVSPDPKTAVPLPPPFPDIERVRHVPDWETPVNPPKRSFVSQARTRLPRAFRRNPLVSTRNITPKSHLTASSVESLSKETILATNRASTIRTDTTHDSVGSRLDKPLPAHRSYLCGLTRRALILVILACIALLALILGLGLGLGLRNRNRNQHTSLPLPDGGQAIHSGDLTYYDPGLGACGWENNNLHTIAAVSHELFDAAGANANTGGNPNMNPLCGKWIRVTREGVTGMGPRNLSVDVMVVDRCTGCAPTDLDLSPNIFAMLVPENRGRVKGSWQWLESP